MAQTYPDTCFLSVSKLGDRVMIGVWRRKGRTQIEKIEYVETHSEKTLIDLYRRYQAQHIIELGSELKNVVREEPLHLEGNLFSDKGFRIDYDEGKQSVSIPGNMSHSVYPRSWFLFAAQEWCVSEKEAEGIYLIFEGDSVLVFSRLEAQILFLKSDGRETRSESFWARLKFLYEARFNNPPGNIYYLRDSNHSSSLDCEKMGVADSIMNVEVCEESIHRAAACHFVNYQTGGGFSLSRFKYLLLGICILGTVAGDLFRESLIKQEPIDNGHENKVGDYSISGKGWFPVRQKAHLLTAFYTIKRIVREWPKVRWISLELSPKRANQETPFHQTYLIRGRWLPGIDESKRIINQTLLQRWMKYPWVTEIKQNFETYEPEYVELSVTLRNVE